MESIDLLKKENEELKAENKLLSNAVRQCSEHISNLTKISEQQGKQIYKIKQETTKEMIINFYKGIISFAQDFVRQYEHNEEGEE